MQKSIPTPQLIVQLKRDEGFYSHPYVCTGNACTIGYGTNLDAHPRFIPYADLRQKASNNEIRGKDLCRALINYGMQWTQAQAEKAMLDEVNTCHKELYSRCTQYVRLIDAQDICRAEVLLNMAFNMGVSGVLSFKNTLALLDKAITSKGPYHAVAAGMLNSKWAKQVKYRANRLSRQMQSGSYQ